MYSSIKLENISKSTHMSPLMTKKLIDIFYTSTDTILEKMEVAIDKEDFDQIFRTAHTIKGSASNLLFESLASVAKEIELSAQKEEYIDYGKKFLKLKDILKNTKII